MLETSKSMSERSPSGVVGDGAPVGEVFFLLSSSEFTGEAYP